MGRRTKNAHPSPIRTSSNIGVPNPTSSPHTTCQPSIVTPSSTPPSIVSSPYSYPTQASKTSNVGITADVISRTNNLQVNFGLKCQPQKVVEAVTMTPYVVNGVSRSNSDPQQQQQQKTFVVISQYEPASKQLRMLPPSNYSTFTVGPVSSFRQKPAVLTDNRSKKENLKVPPQNQTICRPKVQIEQTENGPTVISNFNDDRGSICKFLPSLANQNFPSVGVRATAKSIFCHTERLSSLPGSQKSSPNVEIQSRAHSTFLSTDRARAKLDEAISDGVRAKWDSITVSSLSSRPTKRRLDSITSPSDIAVSLAGSASVTKKGRPTLKLSQQIQQLENTTSKYSALPPANGNITLKQQVSQLTAALPPSIENSSMLIRPIKDVRSATPKYPGNVCEVKLCKVVNSRATDIRALPVNKVLTSSIQLSQKNDGSLSQTAKRFVEYLQKSPESSVDLNITAFKIQCPKRRLYDITNVLEGVGLLEKVSKNVVQWTAKEMELNHVQISSLKDVNAQLEEDEKQLDNAINELHNLYDQEIENCINARFGYVTHDAVTKLDFGQNRLLIFANGPRNTELSLYSPDKLALRSSTGHIEVCMTNTADVLTGNDAERATANNEDTMMTTEVDCCKKPKIVETDNRNSDLLTKYRREIFNHELLRKVEDMAASLAYEERANSSDFSDKSSVTSLGSSGGGTSAVGGGFVSSRISPIDDVSRDSGLDSPTRCFFGGVSTPVLPFTPQQCTHKCTDTCICSTHTDTTSNDSAISNCFTPLNTASCTTNDRVLIPPNTDLSINNNNTKNNCTNSTNPNPTQNCGTITLTPALKQPPGISVRTPIPRPVSQSTEVYLGRSDQVSTYYQSMTSCSSSSNPNSQVKKIESSFKPIPVTEFADYVFTIDNHHEGIVDLFP